MDDRAAFSLCALLAAAGIILLALSMHTASPQRISISDLGAANYGKPVEVSGEVRTIYQRSGNIFLSLCEGECVQAIIFKKTATEIATHGSNPFFLKKGDRIRATGEAQDYKGSPEIVIAGFEVLD